MHRALAVGMTLLSVFALVSSSAGRTLGKPVSKTSATSASRASTGARRAEASCMSCANTSHSARSSKKSVKNLPCHSKGYVDPHVARNYKNAMREMKQTSIKPQVTSVYRSSQEQASLYRCTSSVRCRRANPGLYRALPAGKSAHEAGLAVDIAGVASGPRGGKRLTPKGRRIVAIMRKNGFKWRYGLADPAHFEADPRQHGYRNLKQAITRANSTCRAGIAKNNSHTKTGPPVAASNTTRPRVSTVADTSKTRHRPIKARA